MPTAPVSPELPRLLWSRNCRGSGYARRQQSATAAPATPGESRAPPRLRLRPATAERPAKAQQSSRPSANIRAHSYTVIG